MKLKGKVALVTGAGSGLGKGMVLAFVREGARVAVNDIADDRIQETLQEIAKLGGEGLGVKADVSSSREVKGMFSSVLERFGTLDILVNNAARVPDSEQSMKARLDFYRMKATPIPMRSLEVTRNMSDEEWQAFIDVDLTGVFYCTREALNIMEPKGYGKIINIASTAGLSGMSAFAPHYSAAKGGVIAFTRSVAMEVIGAGVHVNCIAPGGVATPPWQKVPQEVRQIVLQLIPARRMGTVEEYASLAVYLASDDSNYIVGQVISPDGGLLL
ncbi:MAG: SDR family oxidoreductase [candidate division WOR-3 bacterium]